jgi:hypothetical protein
VRPILVTFGRYIVVVGVGVGSTVYQQYFEFLGINNHKSAGVRKVLVIISGVVAIQRRSKWRRFSNSE